MASVKEKILQTRNRSRSHVGYILILFASAFHSPCVIDFRETSARGERVATAGNLRRPYDGCRAFYFRPWDKIEDPVCIPRHSIVIGCRVLLRDDRFETRLEAFGGMEESLIDRCFDRCLGTFEHPSC